jgi:DNA topoisomerase IB
MAKQTSSLVSALTSTVLVPSEVVMSNTTRSAIMSYVSTDMATEAKQAKNLRTISEGLHADGFTGHMLMTLTNGGNESARDQVINSILAGFSKADFALYHKDVKTLDAETKQARTNLRTKKDTYLNRIRTHLFSIDGLDKNGGVVSAEVETESSEVESTKTENQKIHAALAAVITKLQKMDSPDFDVADCVKRIMSAQGMIPLN